MGCLQAQQEVDELSAARPAAHIRERHDYHGVVYRAGDGEDRGPGADHRHDAVVYHPVHDLAILVLLSLRPDDSGEKNGASWEEVGASEASEVGVVCRTSGAVREAVRTKRS